MRATEQTIGRIEPGTSQANPTGTPKVEPLPPLHQGWLSHSKATGPCELTLEKFEELKKRPKKTKQTFSEKEIMIKLILCLSILVLTAQGAIQNQIGYLDTSKVKVRSDSLYYSRGYDLSGMEDIRAILLVDDTSAAGFENDSVNIMWGYQTFSVVLNSSNVPDTVFDQKITLDTVVTASFGNLPAAYGSAAYDGSTTRSTKLIDTLSVTGYASQSKWFIPEWDEGIRFWFKGITGNKTLTGVKCILTVKRRVYINVRMR